MIQQLAGLALGDLSTLTNAPIVKAAMRYWWLTGPVAYVAARKVMKRHSEGKLTFDNVISDLVPILTVVGTLVVINQACGGFGTAPASGPQPSFQNAQPAQFTVTPAPSAPHAVDDGVPLATVVEEG